MINLKHIEVKSDLPFDFFVYKTLKDFSSEVLLPLAKVIQKLI